MSLDKNDLERFFAGTPGNIRPMIDYTSSNHNEWLDYLMKETGGPGFNSPLVNMLRGVRILGAGHQMAPIPDDSIGLAFVNRPVMNLADENVKKVTQLESLYKPRPGSLQAYVKGLLDPEWGRANSGLIGDLLDPYFPWIAPFTNLLKVSSGFPDISLKTGKTEAGFRKIVNQYVDDILKVNDDYDMRLSFHNPKPNILPYIFDVINHYIEAVTLGDEDMMPNPEAIIGNWRDYDMRIYHIILGADFRSLEGIYCNSYCWPNTFPSGAFSTIDRTQTNLYGQGQTELEVSFPSIAMRYNNTQVCDMFNRTTLYFNPNMHPRVRSNYYRKLEVREYYQGGFHAYPWININTMQLEYWMRINGN